MATEGRGVQSIEIGARLLEAIAAAGGCVMLRDIAKATGVAPAQAHAYLVSYRKCNLVEQDKATGRYLLGPLALQLGLARLRSFDPLTAASEAVIEFAARTGLSVAIAVWGSYGPTVVRIHEGADQIHINTRPGTVYSVTGTATGRAFCAFLGRDVVSSALKAQSAEKRPARFVGSVGPLESIEDELLVIRRQGYATVDSNPIPGISALSAPFYETGGNLSGVITIIGTSGSMDLDPAGEFVEQGRALAAAISSRAGYTPPVAEPPPDNAEPGNKSSPVITTRANA